MTLRQSGWSPHLGMKPLHQWISNLQPEHNMLEWRGISPDSSDRLSRISIPKKLTASILATSSGGIGVDCDDRNGINWDDASFLSRLLHCRTGSEVGCDRYKFRWAVGCLKGDVSWLAFWGEDMSPLMVIRKLDSAIIYLKGDPMYSTNHFFFGQQTSTHVLSPLSCQVLVIFMFQRWTMIWMIVGERHWKSPETTWCSLSNSPDVIEISLDHFYWVYCMRLGTGVCSTPGLSWQVLQAIHTVFDWHPKCSAGRGRIIAYTGIWSKFKWQGNGILVYSYLFLTIVIGHSSKPSLLLTSVQSFSPRHHSLDRGTLRFRIPSIRQGIPENFDAHLVSGAGKLPPGTPTNKKCCWLVKV